MQYIFCKHYILITIKSYKREITINYLAFKYTKYQIDMIK
ncbi:hypothetical protein CBC_A0172 [Clostridium botulinum C str. Eklund]|nr:hypothetical protein CBC_A0172 [Clostridium botulinum C str. Eklund]